MVTLSRALRDAMEALWAPIADRAARAYVAGPTVADAMAVCRFLSRQGVASTLGYRNDDGAPPRQVAGQSLAAVATLAAEPMDAYVSIKSPALGGSMDLIGEIVDRAALAGLRVHFDAHGPEHADATLRCIEEAARRGGRVGCALPGRWPRSTRDAALAADLGLSVRVVKGERADPEAPDVDLRAGFLRVVDALAGRVPLVAVATHDAPLARESLRRLRAAGTPVELELLLGLPLEAALREARAAAVPVRIYIPFGRRSPPYHFSSIPRRPRVASWLVRDLLLPLPGAAPHPRVSPLARPGSPRPLAA